MSNICFNCGKELVWQSDCDGDDLGREEKCIVSFYVCPNCNSSYEVTTFLDNLNIEQ